MPVVRRVVAPSAAASLTAQVEPYHERHTDAHHAPACHPSAHYPSTCRPYRRCVVLQCVLLALFAACSAADPLPDGAPESPAHDPTAALDSGPPPAESPQDTFFEGSERVWRDARSRGVTFRAIGQEPGWVLEIEGERQITLQLDYGARRITAPAPAPVIDSMNAVTRYRVAAEGREVRIDIQDEPCADTMSGERFSATVTVMLDGTIYHGCGRALDALL